MASDTTRSADAAQDTGRPGVEVAGPRFRGPDPQGCHPVAARHPPARAALVTPGAAAGAGQGSRGAGARAGGRAALGRCP